jgi:lysophospholipase L1-like esterase
METNMRYKLQIIIAIAALAISSAWMLHRPEASSPGERLPAIEVNSTYDFIQYEKNALHIENPENRWNKLFDRFEQLAFEGEGKISIVHIGGSHVQGGFLTDRLRENFAAMVSDAAGERGFVFPYEIAKTNSPKTIQCSWTGSWTGCRNSVSGSDCEWGMSGINATCNDNRASVSIQSKRTTGEFHLFDRVRIYHFNSKNVMLDLDTTVRLLDVFSDTLSGYTEYAFTPSVSTLNFGYHVTDSLPGFFTLQGVYLSHCGQGITYNAIGVNGASTRSYLKCERFADQLQTLHPDLAIFGIGINDANVPEGDFNADLYEARYDSLIQHFRFANPESCILFVTNNDTYYQKRHPNKNAIAVQQVMYKLARKYDGAVFDLFEIMGGLGSINQWQRAELAASDRVHLSKKGYELQADLMAQAFQKALGDYLDQKYRP